MTGVGGDGNEGAAGGELSHRRSGTGLPAGYGELLAGVKREVRSARVQAARVVNTELIGLYWRIGRLLVERRAAEGWGTAVVERLAGDLRAEFPGMRGFSPRNLAYMRSLAAAYPTAEVLQQPAAQLPWGHLMLLLDKVNDPVERNWYAGQAVAYGWSRAVLSHHLGTQRYRRVGAAPNSFPAASEAADSDLVRELATDPYDLDFLALEPGHSEHDLEDALIARLTHFLAELGAGFAFVGRQYRLPVGGEDFFIDLLFFHLGLRRYVVFELKAGRAQPEHVGKLSFYVTVVDDLLRRPEHGDGPTIGILLAASRNDVVVEYALRGVTAPLAVSTYTTHQALPEAVRQALPSGEDLATMVRDVHSQTGRP